LDNIELYWDWINGVVTTDSNFAKIVSFSDTLYIEQYELYNGMRFDSAYSESEKEMRHFWFEVTLKQNGIEENEIKKLVYLSIPHNKYNDFIEKNNDNTTSNTTL